ncbi:hypothetical protein R84B8_00170 [Treponema sp. R8-4-B8]
MNTKNIAKTGLLICLLYFISVVLLILFSNNITINIMEIITMLSGIYMVLLIISLPVDNKIKHNIYRLLAIIFVSSCMLLTNLIHWINIIVIKQLIKNGINIPEYFKIGTWPSFIMAIDYLGWGLFMGLAFIFSGFMLKLSINIKWILRLNGILCLLGFFGVIINENLWYMAPLGYGIGTLIVCIKLLMMKSEELL